MRKEPRLLLGKSIDSLLLSIEHFNRPWDRGREEVVLILLDRAFELLLKAAIVQKGGKIRESRAKETIGFDKCVRKCFSDASIKFLSEEQALTVQIINSLRDAAQHHLLDISEQQLYLYAQAGITLYAELLEKVFSEKLGAFLPERVLPISIKPPSNIMALFANEFSEIRLLISPGSRRVLQAHAKLRSIAIVEASLRGERSQPGPGELDKAVRALREGINWTDIFPGISGLRLDTSGSGLTMSLRITKNEGEAVHLVPENTPGATVVAIKRVNELGYYNLGLNQLAQNLSLNPPKALAVIRELNIQGDEEYFKIIKIGKAEYKRYSQKALTKIKEELTKLNLEEVWQRNKPKGGRKKRS